MSESAQGESLLLPDRARLLHIGPMKTGTTSLQSAARDRRTELLDHGVLYPGKRLNHRRPVGALMGRAVALHTKSGAIGRDDASAGGVPPRREWDELMAEVNADTSRRVLISHELVGDSSDEVARKFIDEIGPSAHVAITLRAPAAILPSLWAQGLKSAKYEPFDSWLERAFSRADPPMSARFNRRQDQAGIVQRWTNIVGPDNVTVVVADKSNPDLLGHAFEDMLGLPRDLLTAADHDGLSSNRSMTWPEAEYVRRINEALAAESVDWATYIKIVRNGVISRILSDRTPSTDEPRLRLPDWAVNLAIERGRTYADSIAKMGVRVVGDLNSLYARPSSRDDSTASPPSALYVESVVGAVLAAGKLKRKNAAHATDPGPTTVPPPTRKPSGRNKTRTRLRPKRLAKALARRGAALAARIIPRR